MSDTHHIALVIDPWDFPFNGTVVSSRRFVAALRGRYQFQIMACETKESRFDARISRFKTISLPGFNHLLQTMKVPLAKPNRCMIEATLKNCDLVHVQFPFFLGAEVIKVARNMHIPVICSFHVQPENILRNVKLHSSWLSRMLYRLFVHRFYNAANLVLAPSAFAKQLLQREGVTTDIEVLFNGVPMQFFQHCMVHQPRLTTKDFKIVCVGRLASEKQQQLLLTAISQSKYRDKIEVQLIGIGPKKATLKRLSQKLNLKVIVDKVSNQALLDAYASADLCVHPGDIELEGISVLEAMAANKAVLVSDSPDSALASLITNNEARFRHGDVKDLRLQIDRLLSQPLLRRQLAEANLQLAKTHRHDVSASKLDQIYQKMISMKPRGD